MINFKIKPEHIEQAANEHFSLLERQNKDPEYQAVFMLTAQKLADSQAMCTFLKRWTEIAERPDGDFKRSFSTAIVFAFMLGLRTAELHLPPDAEPEPLSKPSPSPYRN